MIFTMILIVLLVGVNGFFAASEMALVSISPSELHSISLEKNKHADSLRVVVSDSTQYLSTIQVAITFAGFLSSAYAGTTFAGYFVQLFSTIGWTISENIMVIAITLLLSFFTLVFGELVPKQIALSYSKKIALFVAPIILLFMKIFKPFVWLLTSTTNLVLRLLPFRVSQESGDITESSIKEMIVYGHIKGLYPEQEASMMQRIFKLDDSTVKMIMTPIDHVTCIDLGQSADSIQQIINETQFSRIPVFDHQHTTIVGVLLLKDLLLPYTGTNIDISRIEKNMRTPFIVSADTTINTVLKSMRQEHEHLAIVEENNAIIGIISLEDIIEEITGDIYDEHDTIPSK